VRITVFKLAPPLAALVLFLGMSALYGFGETGLYEAILKWYGIVPFRFPFLDISGSLAAWECARHGADVILSNPCDVLHRGYNYSPLWMTAAGIPLGVADTTVVGWSLDLLFLLALSLLPPPRRVFEFLLVLAATLSTMVVFALERANPDILLFLLALGLGLLSQHRLPFRLLGYFLGLLAALIKYYPVMVLVVACRERPPIFRLVGLAVAGLLAVFWVEYRVEIVTGLPTVAHGPYNTDLFSAQNLPFLLGEAVENGAGSPPTGRIVSVGLYAILLGVCGILCVKLLRIPELRRALSSLASLERVFLVIGSAVIVGCFFAGQSIGYRGVFLLLVVPGLLALSRRSNPHIRHLGLGTSVVIVLLMWSECFRLALNRVLEDSNVPELLAGELKMYFWLIRELGWWWTVSIMLAVLADFLSDSPIVRWLSSRFNRSVLGVG
jgi:hypothetical protein